MATPKEQHDARPNARSMGPVHHRLPPRDAMGYVGYDARAAAARDAARKVAAVSPDDAPRDAPVPAEE